MFKSRLGAPCAESSDLDRLLFFKVLLKRQEGQTRTSLGPVSSEVPPNSCDEAGFRTQKLPSALAGEEGGTSAAAFLVKSLPLAALRWLVVGVVLYAAFSMLRSAAIEKRARIATVTPTGVPSLIED